MISVVYVLLIISSALSFQYEMQKPIKCMNFYGLETQYKNFVCSWKNQPEFFLRRLQQDMDINTIRVPFSYEYITGSDISKLQEIIQTCQQLNIDIILDWHRTWSSHQGAVPEEGITLDIFVSAWINLLERFKVYPNVKGVGIFNEVQLLNDFPYVHKMHRYILPMLEAQFPNRFSYFIGCPSWGGNCSSMDFSDLTVWNKTYIEVHKYRFSGKSDRADWDVSIPASIPPERWFVGEVGWKQTVDEDQTWAKGFLQYLVQRNITNACLWTIAHSGDTDGWFKDDCESFDEDKAKEVTNTIWKKQQKHNLRLTFEKQNIFFDPSPLPPPPIVGGDNPIWTWPQWPHNFTFHETVQP